MEKNLKNKREKKRWKAPKAKRKGLTWGPKKGCRRKEVK